jgi:hypothetical protein
MHVIVVLTPYFFLGPLGVWSFSNGNLTNVVVVVFVVIVIFAVIVVVVVVVVIFFVVVVVVVVMVVVVVILPALVVIIIIIILRVIFIPLGSALPVCALYGFSNVCRFMATAVALVIQF